MKNSGLTLIEIILVLSTMLIIASILVSALSQFNKRVGLSKDAERVVFMIRKAKSNTLASRGGLQYGVHFENKKAVMFVGDTYVPSSSTNESISFQPSIVASTISLAGGGNDIILKRLTGLTDQSGFIILSIAGAPTISRQINISTNGIVNIQ